MKLNTRKIVGQVHLWLGLVSGIVVFIVGITGCMYVFRDEISRFTKDAPVKVNDAGRPYLPPSALIANAAKYLPNIRPSGMGLERGQAVRMNFFGKDYNYALIMDPHTGKLIKKLDNRNNNGRFDFFGFALDGHLNLWLPYKIGRPIVDYSILAFFVLLITGLVLWWPRNWKKHNRDKSFKIKWAATFKRLNYDLHNVLGFYALLILLMIASTGLVWAFSWFQKSLYWTTSGGKSSPGWVEVHSDTTFTGTPVNNGADSVWKRRWVNNNKAGSIYIAFPDKRADAFFVNVNTHPGTLYRQEIYYYDRYTLKELYGGGVYSLNRYSTASLADKINRMNYDIHVGQIGGLPTKIVAFFASLIAASLPVTGFLVWWGRRNKKKKKPAGRAAANMIRASVKI